MSRRRCLARSASSLLVLPGTLLLFAEVAQASYGQMRLDGVGFLLAFLLLVAYGIAVDLGLIARLFRHRAGVAVGLVGAVLVIGLLLWMGALPSERHGYFKGAPGGASLMVLVLTGAVFLPFIVVAPIAQFRALERDPKGRAWPRGVSVGMGLQLALVPIFVVLAVTDDYCWKREYAAGQVVGAQVRAGAVEPVAAQLARRHERIWGTPWHTPWPAYTPPGSYPRSSGWVAGVAKGIEGSAFIASDEPLSPADRAALQALIAKDLGIYAHPRVDARLLWDDLQPGRFAEQLAPAGVDESNAVGEEVVAALMERFDRVKDGDTRLCPGGRMKEEDRALLHALIEKRGRLWNVEKQDYVMRPDWAGFPQRLDRVCPGEDPGR